VPEFRTSQILVNQLHFRCLADLGLLRTGDVDQ
jgi:hypothetical protein